MIGKGFIAKKSLIFFFERLLKCMDVFSSDIPFVQQMLLIEIITLSASVALR